MRDAVLKGKQAIVQEIEEKIKNSQSLVLVDYRGLTVEEVTNLRNEYRKNNVEYKVYKNTLMKFAFDNLGYTDFAEVLKGPSAVAFSMEDATSSAKVTNNFAKENDKLKIKAGIVDGKILDVAGVVSLASIPSREVLLTKLLGSIKSPVANFVYLADALAKKKAEDGEAATVEEAKEEAAPVEEVKAEATEEPKVEEPEVTEEPKVEEPAKEEPEVEVPTKEEPKVEEPPVEEPTEENK